MITKRNMVSQNIYLEPATAELLDELAASTRIPKAVLMREAVDDLLSRHNMGVITPRYVKMRAALKAARTQLTAYRRVIGERKLGLIPLQGCDAAIGRIDEARNSVGD